MTEAPLIPDYGRNCLASLLPALLGPTRPRWLPAPVQGARAVVLLLLDGLGWEQLGERAVRAPTLTAMAGGPILSVVPSTTATALTSVMTGLPPSEHGVVGYRILTEAGVLNTLRWSIDGEDARNLVPPVDFQPVEPFLGLRPPVVTRAEFDTTGFTGTHLRGARLHGWRTVSNLVVEVRRLVLGGEPFVYAYYDGVDKVSHATGLGEHFDAEVAFADRLVSAVLDELPPDVALVVTADHGQVDVGDRIIHPSGDVLAMVAAQSGEGRFRWLHARSGATADLEDACASSYGDVAWVVSRERMVDESWFGPRPGAAVVRRLGDVALVPHAPVAFHDPDDTGPFQLVGRHGSLTSAEMLVPLVAARGRRSRRRTPSPLRP